MNFYSLISASGICFLSKIWFFHILKCILPDIYCWDRIEVCWRCMLLTLIIFSYRWVLLRHFCNEKLLSFIGVIARADLFFLASFIDLIPVWREETIAKTPLFIHRSLYSGIRLSYLFKSENTICYSFACLTICNFAIIFTGKQLR